MCPSPQVGEQTTWEKLATIQCNCTIEATLDQCLVRVLNKAREQPMAPMRSRIPSWLHMAHIGQPAIASWGGLDTTGGRGDAAAARQLNSLWPVPALLPVPAAIIVPQHH